MELALKLKKIPLFLANKILLISHINEETFFNHSLSSSGLSLSQEVEILQ